MDWYPPLRNKITALLSGQNEIDKHVYVEPPFETSKKLRVFMWHPDDVEQVREDNWWWLEDVGVPEAVHIMDKILDYCAVVGIRDEASEFDALVLLDALYGMAVQAAIRNQENPYKIEMPRIFGVGDSKNIQTLIRWRNYMGFAVDQMAEHMMQDPRVSARFIGAFQTQPMYAKEILRRLYVAPNITLICRSIEIEQELFLDPLVHRDCGYAGATGWYRVQCLMQGMGYDVDLGVKASQRLKVAVEVLDFMLATYKNTVHEDVFAELSKIKQYNTNTYVIGDR